MLVLYRTGVLQDGQLCRCKSFQWWAHRCVVPWITHLSNARFTDLLLEKEPANLQGQSLGSLIEQGVTRGTALQVFVHCMEMSDLPFQRAMWVWHWLEVPWHSGQFLLRV